MGAPACLALCMPYYRNPGMLRRHLAVWREEWSADLRSAVEVVIVDDGSPEESAAEAIAGEDLDGVGLSLYRVMDDRPWHQHGARNLAAHVATADYVLMTDMDHVLPAETLAEVLRRIPLAVGEALTFGRVDAPAGRPWRADGWRSMAPTVRDDGSLKHHVNSFAMARDLYWSVGGYDERYCGVYGTDQRFRSRLWAAASETHLDGHPLIRVGRDVLPDASTRNVKRKNDDCRGLVRAAIDRAIRMSGDETPCTLKFEWERVL